jgi:hypothetical protein
MIQRGVDQTARGHSRPNGVVRVTSDLPPTATQEPTFPARRLRANRRHVSFHDQDRAVCELYNSIGSAANHSVVDR